MSIKSIVKLGNKELSTPALPVTEFGTDFLKNLIQNMHDTMIERNGVGIAAPQIGVNLQVTIFGFEKNERYPNQSSVPFTIFINPKIEILSDEQIEMYEGCLSIPGLRAVVPRYKKIKYTAFDLNGQPISGIAEDFHARIIQHECDHLHGVLYPERIKNIRTLGFEDELKNR